jgi:hypothetical protein
MGKKLMLAVALVALMAMPAFASVQNVKVGGDLKTTSVIRNNFVSGALALASDSQNVILSQIGLNVQADLTDNVSTTLRLVNERLWGDSTGTGTDASSVIRVDAAYVTMKEMLYSPLTVVIGRQPLVYGNQFLIGDLSANTEVPDVTDITGGANADAIKAILTYDPLTIDLFAAKIDNGVTIQDGNDDISLYGINANYKVGDSMNTVVEAYTFVKIDKGAPIVADTEANKLYVPGLRVSTNPIEGLNVQLEGAYQFGDGTTVGGYDQKADISAYGLQAGLNYALPVMKDMKPVLSAGYTYLSGDKSDPALDNKLNAFQPLYENQYTGRIFDTLGLAASNVKMANLALEVVPVQDVTAKLSVYNLNLAKKAGSVARLGNEVDLDVTYAYTEDVKLGVSAGIFYPGKAYASTTEQRASQVLTSVNVLF